MRIMNQSRSEMNLPFQSDKGENNGFPEPARRMAAPAAPMKSSVARQTSRDVSDGTAQTFTR
jgi:hypothetical protein